MRGCALLLCLGAFRLGLCQVSQWPVSLQLPEQGEAPADSSRVGFVSGQNLYINTFKNHDSLTLRHVDSLYTAGQSMVYDLNNDALFNSRNQYIDMSGMVLRKNAFHGISLGLDWTPTIVINSLNGSEGVLGSMDIGPIVRLNPWHIPVSLRAGAAAKTWNDSLSSNLKQVRMNQFRNDKGYYGAFEIGDAVRPVFNLPLYFNAKVYDRSMENSKLVAAIGSALLIRGLPTGDSLFILYADSLINGKDAALGQGQDGKTRYTNIAQRMERSYQVTGGLKGKQRLFLLPAMTYSLSRYTFANYSEANSLSDRRDANNTVNFMLATRPDFFIKYSGGLCIDWETEDRVPGGLSSLIANSDGSNLDSLRVSLNGYNGYKATMANYFSMDAGKGRSLRRQSRSDREIS